MAIQITSVSHLRAAIKGCRQVQIQVRFGCSEAWVAITKQEALRLVKALPKNATPADSEMDSGAFGSADDGIVYLG